MREDPVAIAPGSDIATSVAVAPGFDVEIGSLLTVVHVLHAHQVHVFFRARLRSTDVGAGPESLEVELITPEQIPWADLAFPSTEFTLQRYLEDRECREERHHFTEFDKRGVRG